MPGRVISGTAVGAIASGVILAYAGLRGINPLAALRDVATGAPPAVPDKRTDLDVGLVAATVPGAISGATGAAVAGAGVGPALVRAALGHAGERYSQTRRWDSGFSDCSSFVGKSLRDIGIAPPPLSLAASYVAWPKLAKVPRSAVAIGDLIANVNHIIIATGPNDAIGQQNSNQNVQRGKIENLMWGTGAFVCLRLKLSGTAASAAAGGAGG